MPRRPSSEDQAYWNNILASEGLDAISSGSVSGSATQEDDDEETEDRSTVLQDGDDFEIDYDVPEDPEDEVVRENEGDLHSYSFIDTEVE
jgi:hypothetical protein